MNPRVIGRNLRRMMREENITGAMLSEWSGVHINTIYRLCSTNHSVLAHSLYKLAVALRRPMDEFFKEEPGDE